MVFVKVIWQKNNLPKDKMQNINATKSNNPKLKNKVIVNLAKTKQNHKLFNNY